MGSNSYNSWIVCKCKLVSNLLRHSRLY